MNLPFYTNALVSPSGKVNQADIKSWLATQALFLVPLVLLYLAQLQVSLQSHGVILVADLVPTAITVGAAELYLLNAVTGFLKKLTDGTK